VAAAVAAAAEIAAVVAAARDRHRCRRTRHTVACGGRHLATRNELRPPHSDSYALLYFLLKWIAAPEWMAVLL